MTGEFPKSGLVGIWKPIGMTSHDAVNAVRRLSGERRVGHAGTLDPLASGVLVMGIGREATKTLSVAVAHEKEYIAQIRFGITSSTDDEEGEKVAHQVPNIPSLEDLEVAKEKFIGHIMQMPPAYSALKVKGRPSYAYARAGLDAGLKAREVFIKEIEVMSYVWPDLSLRLVTGAGVYIRAIARDLGEALGVGGYLTGLVRTRVGSVTRESCFDIVDV